jgi:preprotein translocase subunit YajC
MHLMNLIADGAAAAPAAPAPTGGGQQPGGPFGGMMIPMMAILAIFIFFSWNSKRKQDKQRQVALAAMKRGDRVQTIGGIMGTIVEVRDAEIVVKVDESNNTKIKFARSAVSKLVGDEDKADAK